MSDEKWARPPDLPAGAHPLASQAGKAGLPPGVLVPVGEDVRPTRITVMDYDAEHLKVQALSRAEDVSRFRDKPTVTWIDVSGLKDVETIEKIGRTYGIHPLVLEDVLNVDQRPKLEIFDEYVFTVFKTVWLKDEKELEVEQVSAILGERFVITFQEREGDVFELLRVRISNSRGRVRKSGADYLFYAILDIVIDNYFPVVERLEATLEELEDRILSLAAESVVEEMHDMRRTVLELKRYAGPMREVARILMDVEEDLMTRNVHPYLRDLYDHVIRVTESLEILREGLSALREMYLSAVSNRMNAVMKVLTIIATVFMPMTFIVGVYGMNFEYMPELKWRWGYPAVWGVMLITAGFMIRYFKRKKWL